MKIRLNLQVDIETKEHSTRGLSILNNVRKNIINHIKSSRMYFLNDRNTYIEYDHKKPKVRVINQQIL